MMNAMRKIILLGIFIAACPITQAASNSQQEEPPPSVSAGPSYRLPKNSFISSQSMSIICTDRTSALAMLNDVGKSKLPATLKLNRCRHKQVPIEIQFTLGRKTVELSNQGKAEYIAFVGSNRHRDNNEARIFGVINETENNVAPNTAFENWQNEFARVGGVFRLYPNFAKVTAICARPADTLKLIKAKKAIVDNPSDPKLVKRIELLLTSCPPAYGTFQPLTMMKQWKNADGWTWTAIKAKDERGNVVGLLHIHP
jgi:hypothetical protein